MRPNEADLAVALGVVAHGRDDDIDAILGELRNAGGCVDADEVGIDAKAPG